MNTIDPLKLQRLVDGELNLEQIQELIKNADDHPSHWREIAASLIEEQLWRQTMDSTNASSNESDVASPVKSSLLETAEYPVPAFNESSKHSEITAHSFDPEPRQKRMSVWVAVAASIFFAGMIGYGLQQMGKSGKIAVEPKETPAVQDNLIAQNSNSDSDLNTNTSPTPKMTPASYQPDYHLQFPQDNKFVNSLDSSPLAPVPLYSVNNQDQLRQFEQRQSFKNRITPELLRKLNQAGYQVKQDVEFISGNMNNDRSFVVPVRRIRFIPSH